MNLPGKFHILDLYNIYALYANVISQLKRRNYLSHKLTECHMKIKNISSSLKLRIKTPPSLF